MPVGFRVSFVFSGSATERRRNRCRLHDSLSLSDDSSDFFLSNFQFLEDVSSMPADLPADVSYIAGVWCEGILYGMQISFL